MEALLCLHAVKHFGQSVGHRNQAGLTLQKLKGTPDTTLADLARYLDEHELTETELAANYQR